MDIDLLSYVKRELLSMPRAKRKQIAEAASVGTSTMEKIIYDVTKDPGAMTVQKLANALMNRKPH